MANRAVNNMNYDQREVIWNKIAAEINQKAAKKLKMQLYGELVHMSQMYLYYK